MAVVGDKVERGFGRRVDQDSSAKLVQGQGRATIAQT